MRIHRVTVRLAVPLAVLGVVWVAGHLLRAHEAIGSRYTYHTDVFPILESRCGRCHTAGGVAPMSLLTYDDAFPWAESIRDQVLGLSMPPWAAQDGIGSFKEAHRLTAEEMDTLVDWSVGGTPEGDRIERRRPAVDPRWTLGEPDLAIPMAAPHIVDSDTTEEVRLFLLETGLEEDRWLRAVDLRPGAPAMVRSATVFADPTGRARELGLSAGSPALETMLGEGLDRDRILAAWLPGQRAIAAENGAGFLLAAGADLVLRVHYRKTWNYEGTAVRDHSTVGLYFSSESDARPIRALSVTAEALDDSPTGWVDALSSALVTGEAEASLESFGSSVTLDRDAEVVALVPEMDRPAVAVRVDVTRPGESPEPILHLDRPTPEWQRRYWLEDPLAVPAGTAIAVTASFERGVEPPSADVDRVRVRDGAAAGRPHLRMLIDLVPQVERESALLAP